MIENHTIQTLWDRLRNWVFPLRPVGIQWLRDGQPIPGATRSTYTVTRDDEGRWVAAAVQYERTLRWRNPAGLREEQP